MKVTKVSNALTLYVTVNFFFPPSCENVVFVQKDELLRQEGYKCQMTLTCIVPNISLGM